MCTDVCTVFVTTCHVLTYSLCVQHCLCIYLHERGPEKSLFPLLAAHRPSWLTFTHSNQRLFISFGHMTWFHASASREYFCTYLVLMKSEEKKHIGDCKIYQLFFFFYIQQCGLEAEQGGSISVSVSTTQVEELFGLKRTFTNVFCILYRLHHTACQI